MYRGLVIFDLDGTLIDTIEDLGTAVNHILESTGRPTHPIEAYRFMVGNGIRKLVQRALPDSEKGVEDLPDRLLPEFKRFYLEHIYEHSRPYPGVAELLCKLQEEGYALAVASNKFQEGTSVLVSHFFPDIEFVAVYGGCDERPLKPDPTVIEDIMHISGVPSEMTVMVGDSGTDIQTARNASVRSIGVSWGFRPDTASAADVFVHSAAELYDAAQSCYGNL